MTAADVFLWGGLALAAIAAVVWVGSRRADSPADGWQDRGE